jgi:hypothetical protein
MGRPMAKLLALRPVQECVAQVACVFLAVLASSWRRRVAACEAPCVRARDRDDAAAGCADLAVGLGIASRVRRPSGKGCQISRALV